MRQRSRAARARPAAPPAQRHPPAPGSRPGQQADGSHAPRRQPVQHVVAHSRQRPAAGAKSGALAAQAQFPQHTGAGRGQRGIELCWRQRQQCRGSAPPLADQTIETTSQAAATTPAARWPGSVARQCVDAGARCAPWPRWARCPYCCCVAGISSMRRAAELAPSAPIASSARSMPGVQCELCGIGIHMQGQQRRRQHADAARGASGQQQRLQRGVLDDAAEIRFARFGGIEHQHVRTVWCTDSCQMRIALVAADAVDIQLRPHTQPGQQRGAPPGRSRIHASREARPVTAPQVAPVRCPRCATAGCGPPAPAATPVSRRRCRHQQWQRRKCPAGFIARRQRQATGQARRPAGRNPDSRAAERALGRGQQVEQQQSGITQRHTAGWRLPNTRTSASVKPTHAIAISAATAFEPASHPDSPMSAPWAQASISASVATSRNARLKPCPPPDAVTARHCPAARCAAPRYPCCASAPADNGHACQGPMRDPRASRRPAAIHA